MTGYSAAAIILSPAALLPICGCSNRDESSASLLFFIYLAVVVLIGLRCTRNVRNADDFYVAGRRAGALNVAGSLLATVLGSSAILGSVDFAYVKGWAGAWFMLCGALGLTALFFMTKALASFRVYSLPELLGKFYGPRVRRVSSGVIALAWLGVIGAQLIGAGMITGTICGIPYRSAVALIALALAVYTATGGQFSIIRTDLFQLAFVLTGIVGMFVMLFFRHPKLEALPMISAKFTLSDLAVMIVAYSSTYLVGPDIYSRLFCARDLSTARRSLLVAVAVLVPMAFILAYLGIYGANFHRAAGGGNVLFAIANAEFSRPMTLLLYFTILSAIMSSADTTLFTASALLSQFFVPDIGGNARSIRVTRICVVCIAGTACGIALFNKSILDVLLFALSIYSGAFVLPTAWVLLGLPSSRKHGVCAMIVGGSLALAGKAVGGNIGNMLVLAAFASGLLILLAGKRKTPHVRADRRRPTASDEKSGGG
ncbi:MAG: sodium:solute symporter family protein [Lentisphaeria bacterium]|nr:sodium:solute symporter family protein [Lentisphaeria bacterium]